MTSRSPAAKPAKTMTMSRAAEVMIRPERCRPERHGLAGVVALLVQLDDPREEEDLVVHRQAEAEREHEQRDGVLERRRPR